MKGNVKSRLNLTFEPLLHVKQKMRIIITSLSNKTEVQHLPIRYLYSSSFCFDLNSSSFIRDSISDRTVFTSASAFSQVWNTNKEIIFFHLKIQIMFEDSLLLYQIKYFLS